MQQLLSSLELLLEVCRIWAMGPKVKGPMVPNFSRTYLDDCWTNFHASKAIWNPLDPQCRLAWSLSLWAPGASKGPWGPNLGLFSLSLLRLNLLRICSLLAHTKLTARSPVFWELGLSKLRASSKATKSCLRACSAVICNISRTVQNEMREWILIV